MKRRSQTAAEESKRKAGNNVDASSSDDEQTFDDWFNAKHKERRDLVGSDPSFCLTAKLLAGMNNMSASQTLEISNETKDIFSSIMKHFKDSITKVLQQDEEAKKSISGIDAIFEKMSKPKVPEAMSSVHSCFGRYEKLGTLIMPLSFPVPCSTKDGKEEFFTSNAQIIPLREVLQKFFETPNLINETEIHLEKLYSSSIISNFVQGAQWKKKSEKFGKKFTLPLILHFQTYEKYNPLRVFFREVIKIGEIFVEIPCLPPDYMKDLRNVFSFVLFSVMNNEKIRFNQEAIMAQVVKELKFLKQKGISIRFPNGEKKIYFDIGLVIADNPRDVGFRESCAETKICTHCLTTRSELETIFLENECKLRDKAVYDNQIQENDPLSTGIQETCHLNKLNNFHVSENFVIDHVDTLLTSACRHDMAVVLKNLIFEEKVISYENFIARLQSAKSDDSICCYKPKEVKEKEIKNDYIALTAPEMYWLITFLPYVILEQAKYDPKIVLKYDRVITFGLYQQLAQVISILAKQEITEDQITKFNYFVAKYFEERKRLLPNRMTRTHHNLIHCGRLIGNNGPLWNFYLTRFQKRIFHRHNIAELEVNPLNVIRKVARKHQLILNHRFLLDDVTRKEQSIQSKAKYPYKEFDQAKKYKNFLSEYSEDEIYILNWIDFRGQKIKSDDILKSTPTGDMYQVCEIVLCKKEVLVIVKVIRKFYVKFQNSFRALFFTSDADDKYCTLNMSMLADCKKLTSAANIGKSELENCVHISQSSDENGMLPEIETDSVVFVENWFERF